MVSFVSYFNSWLLVGLRAKERKTMGTFSVDRKDAGKGKLENEINQCLGGLPTRKILNNSKTNRSESKPRLFGNKINTLLTNLVRSR